jgi:hypothetical protein
MSFMGNQVDAAPAGKKGGPKPAPPVPSPAARLRQQTHAGERGGHLHLGYQAPQRRGSLGQPAVEREREAQEPAVLALARARGGAGDCDELVREAKILRELVADCW